MLVRRLGDAGGLFCLYSASLGSRQEAFGEHVGLLLWHQRASAAASVPRRHRPHRWRPRMYRCIHPCKHIQRIALKPDFQSFACPGHLSYTLLRHCYANTQLQSDKSWPRSLDTHPRSHISKNALIFQSMQQRHHHLKPVQIIIKPLKVQSSFARGSWCMMSWGGGQWSCVSTGQQL